jgi:hypothetical protein
LEQGRAAEILDTFRRVAEQTRYPGAIAIDAVISYENGEEERAVRLFDELAATDFAHPTNNVGWLWFHGFCAILCAHLGRRDCVPVLQSRLEPWVNQLIVAAFAGWVSGPVAFHLGLLATIAGDWEQAESYFSAAAATQERIAAPAGLARTHLERARMLLTRARPGDREQAQDLLHHALATARDLKLAKIEQDAVSLLA